jgi:hypothetical protein
MIAIDKTLISEDVLDKKFVCDLNACKGECCVAGDSGAPLDKDELQILDSILDNVKPYMDKKGIKAIEKYGAYVIDKDGDYTTKCAIEQANIEGKIDSKKPISCHLYPIRISKHNGYDAVNYSKWDICSPACACGKKLDVPVYKFLKVPLIRKYGKDWFNQLEISAQLYLKK